MVERVEYNCKQKETGKKVHPCTKRFDNKAMVKFGSNNNDNSNIAQDNHSANNDKMLDMNICQTDSITCIRCSPTNTTFAISSWDVVYIFINLFISNSNNKNKMNNEIIIII